MSTRTLILFLLIAVAVSACTAILYRYWYIAPDAATALRRGQYDQAFILLTGESNQGNPQAQLQLGNMLYTGLGRQTDYAAAHHWYRLSALRANVSAQYNLGIMYQQGLGTTADIVTAAAWFMLANNAGHPLAKIHLRTISGSLNPNKIQEAAALHDAIEQEIKILPTLETKSTTD